MSVDSPGLHHPASQNRAASLSEPPRLDEGADRVGSGDIPPGLVVENSALLDRSSAIAQIDADQGPSAPGSVVSTANSRALSRLRHRHGNIQQVGARRAAPGAPDDRRTPLRIRAGPSPATAQFIRSRACSRTARADSPTPCYLEQGFFGWWRDQVTAAVLHPGPAGRLLALLKRCTSSMNRKLRRPWRRAARGAASTSARTL